MGGWFVCVNLEVLEDVYLYLRWSGFGKTNCRTTAGVSHNVIYQGSDIIIIEDEYGTCILSS